MRTDYFKIICVASFFIFACACGYSVGGNPGGTDVILSPADGTTEQAVDVGVTADFSDTVEVPEDWSTVFTLKLNGSGDNLCTSYNYDGDQHIATCLHDDLDANTSYDTLVTGMLTVNGKNAMWRTAE